MRCERIIPHIACFFFSVLATVLGQLTFVLGLLGKPSFLAWCPVRTGVRDLGSVIVKRPPLSDCALDQFGRSCARVEKVSLDERLNAARQVRYKIYKKALETFRPLIKSGQIFLSGRDVVVFQCSATCRFCYLPVLLSGGRAGSSRGGS